MGKLKEEKKAALAALKAKHEAELLRLLPDYKAQVREFLAKKDKASGVVHKKILDALEVVVSVQEKLFQKTIAGEDCVDPKNSADEKKIGFQLSLHQCKEACIGWKGCRALEYWRFDGECHIMHFPDGHVVKAEPVRKRHVERETQGQCWYSKKGFSGEGVDHVRLSHILKMGEREPVFAQTEAETFLI